VQRSLKRLWQAGLFDRRRRTANISQAEEFLIHGVKYVFPGSVNGESRGFATAWGAQPLADKLAAPPNDVPPVWPSAHGDTRGLALEPLHASAVEAAKQDPLLREQLTLVDAIRIGDARIRGLAADLLAERLGDLDVNIELLELAESALGRLVDEVVFVGGATVGLWISDPAAPPVRPTDDVDVVVEVATRSEFYEFEAKLRDAGFSEDEQGDVICRWHHRETGLILNAMPSRADILGFENEWQTATIPHAVAYRLPSGVTIRAAPPVYMLAMKLEAFKGRGKGDSPLAGLTSLPRCASS